MTWQTEMTPIVRYLVDDIASALYTDARIQTTIVISSQLVVFDVEFDKSYTISVADDTITPDPTATTRDDAFINLVSLKTACIILSAEAKVAGGTAMKIKDGGRFGSSEIDTGKVYDALQKMADIACKNYQDARTQYQAGNGRAGEAIIGPYVSNNVQPYPGNFS